MDTDSAQYTPRNRLELGPLNADRASIIGEIIRSRASENSLRWRVINNPGCAYSRFCPISERAGLWRDQTDDRGIERLGRLGQPPPESRHHTQNTPQSSFQILPRGYALFERYLPCFLFLFQPLSSAALGQTLNRASGAARGCS